MILDAALISVSSGGASSGCDRMVSSVTSGGFSGNSCDSAS